MTDKTTIQFKTKVIGLTGIYCAGKNHVAKILESRSLPVLDLDKLGHEVIKNEKDLLVKRFGADILDKNGFVDRKLLGAKVFNRPPELEALEGIIHPAVDKETLRWIEKREEPACVINAALLHRSSIFNKLDAIILVEAPFPVRLLRARKRDKLPWKAIFRRFRIQSRFYSQYFKEKTDIYRVSNPWDYTSSGPFRFIAGSLRKKLESRIDEILSFVMLHEHRKG